MAHFCRSAPVQLRGGDRLASRSAINSSLTNFLLGLLQVILGQPRVLGAGLQVSQLVHSLVQPVRWLGRREHLLV